MSCKLLDNSMIDAFACTKSYETCVGAGSRSCLQITHAVLLDFTCVLQVRLDHFIDLLTHGLVWSLTFTDTAGFKRPILHLFLFLMSLFISVDNWLNADFCLISKGLKHAFSDSCVFSKTWPHIICQPILTPETCFSAVTVRPAVSYDTYGTYKLK